MYGRPFIREMIFRFGAGFSQRIVRFCKEMRMVLCLCQLKAIRFYLDGNIKVHVHDSMMVRSVLEVFCF